MGSNSITFIQTGGTIDKDYPRKTKGWAFEIGEPAFIRILNKIDPSFEYEYIKLFQKDSLEITVQDRESLADAIISLESKFVIISHGTDTMIDTAGFLSKQISDKVIIITGAMRPERFSDSDAEFNLGCAVGAVFNLAPGVYIAMQGIVKTYDIIKRDTETGRFYS
ncbi:MAG: asparaginase [Bacteroidales bacterium]|nr:asparaginase [Bacteroidales bacterium]MCF8391454.1 asparaginase [Bacteroidales bacterium]